MGENTGEYHKIVKEDTRSLDYSSYFPLDFPQGLPFGEALQQPKAQRSLSWRKLRAEALKRTFVDVPKTAVKRRSLNH